MNHKNKRSLNLLDSSVFLVIVIAIVVAINLILLTPSVRLHRADLTRNRLYTLSPTSKGLVSDLDQPLLFKLFISEDLQYPDHDLEQQVRDLLEEYEAAARGQVRFEIIHPGEEDQPTLEAGPDGQPLEQDLTDQQRQALEEGPRGFGIQKVPVGVRGRDEVVLRNIYKGLAIVYGDRSEVIGELKGSANLEYEITKRIKTLVAPDTAYHTLGFAKGFGGPADSPGFIDTLGQAFAQIYGDLVQVKAIDLHDPKVMRELMTDCATLDKDACAANSLCRAASQDAPPEAPACRDGLDALVVLNPQDTFTPSARFAMDQFLMRGHGVAWLQTTSKARDQQVINPEREPVTTGLEEQFAHYGLRLESNLVLDRRNNIVSLILTERGPVQISNPFMPELDDINQESVITRDVPFLVFPLASSVSVDDKVRTREDLTLTELVRSSPDAVARPSLVDIDYEKLAEPSQDEVPGPFVMAAALQGRMDSFWSSQDKPATEPASKPGQPPLEFPDPIKTSREGARVVVVGNGEFMFPNRQSGYTSDFSGIGALFLLNMVDWLVQDEGLVSIRAKGIPAVIKDVEPEQYTTWQFLNIAGVPLAFALFGLLFWLARRKRQRELTL